MFLALLYNTLCPFLICSHLDGKERAASFTLIGLQCMIVVGPGQTYFLFWFCHATAYTYLKVVFFCRDTHRKQWVNFCHKYLLPIVVY